MDFPEPTHGFERASAAGVRDGMGSSWIVAGMEVDKTAEADAGMPRVVHERLGTIAPPRPTSGWVESPVPVALPSGRWGLLWVEPTSRREAGAPLSLSLRAVWFAEWDATRGGWSAARAVFETQAGIWWHAHRGLAYAPDGQPFVMVHTWARGLLMLGPAGDALRPVPIDAVFGVRGAALAFDPRGTMILAVVADDRPSAPRLPLHRMLLLTGRDRGARWSEPEPLWPVSLRFQDMRLHVDRNGALHLLWRTSGRGGDTIYHAVRGPGAQAWSRHALHRPGILFRWVSGIDRCGRLAVIIEIGDSPAGPRLEAARWTRATGWSAFASFHREYWGGDLFDGQRPDGTWYVGWTGDRNDARNLDLKVYLTTP